MIFCLSMLSQQCVGAFLDDQDSDWKILALVRERQVTRVQLNELYRELTAMLSSKTPPPSAAVFFNGPGSFTGLRSSASFLSGLCGQLEIPLYSASIKNIGLESISIPVRAALSQKKSFRKALGDEDSFFKITQEEVTTSKLDFQTSALMGLKSSELWPTPSQILNLARIAVEKKALLNDIEYGMTPQFRKTH